MKLEYKILWFDDSEELLDSIDWDYLKDGISQWGFVPKIETVLTAEDFAQASWGDFDLLVVDYKLEGYGEGQDFIANVRNQEILTEVMFYSAGDTSLLWDAIRENKLEGIYVANKNGILERILRVGQQTLRKILDLENMRGIVMAEVGDLDLLLSDIVAAAMETLDEKTQQTIFDKFHLASSEHHDAARIELETFKGAPTIEVLLALCDSDKRWQNYRRLAKHHTTLKKAGNLGNYVSEILSPRNFLAHGVPTRMEDGSFVFEYRKKKYTFDDAASLALRLKIIEYKTALTAIAQELLDEQKA